MRLFFVGPRLFGGLVRPGVSFGMPRWRRAQQFGRASANWGSVYVLEGAPGHVKIGESNDPVSRRAALQTGSPFPLRLVFSIPCPRAYDIEQEAHAILAAHRTMGGNDWFLADKETAIGAIFGAASRLGISLGGEESAPPTLRERTRLIIERWRQDPIWPVAVALTAAIVMLNHWHVIN